MTAGSLVCVGVGERQKIIVVGQAENSPWASNFGPQMAKSTLQIVSWK